MGDKLGAVFVAVFVLAIIVIGAGFLCNVLMSVP